jgi:hypothetical protein
MGNVHAFNALRRRGQMQGFCQPIQNGLPVLVLPAAGFFAGIGLGQVHKLIIRRVPRGHNTHRPAPAVRQSLFQQGLAA